MRKVLTITKAGARLAPQNWKDLFQHDDSDSGRARIWTIMTSALVCACDTTQSLQLQGLPKGCKSARRALFIKDLTVALDSYRPAFAHPVYAVPLVAYVVIAAYALGGRENSQSEQRSRKSTMQLTKGRNALASFSFINLCDPHLVGIVHVLLGAWAEGHGANRCGTSRKHR